MGEGGTVRPCCMLTLMEAFLHYIAAAHMNSSALHRCSIGRQLERNLVGVIEAQRISTVWGFPFIAVCTLEREVSPLHSKVTGSGCVGRLAN